MDSLPQRLEAAFVADTALAAEAPRQLAGSPSYVGSRRTRRHTRAVGERVPHQCHSTHPGIPGLSPRQMEIACAAGGRMVIFLRKPPDRPALTSMPCTVEACTWSAVSRNAGEQYEPTQSDIPDRRVRLIWSANPQNGARAPLYIASAPVNDLVTYVAEQRLLTPVDCWLVPLAGREQCSIPVDHS